MKKLLGVLTIAVAAVFLIPGNLVAANNPKVQSLNSIVAVVNQSPITQTELEMAMHDDRLQLQAMHQPVPPLKVFRKQVLDRLINLRMQLELAKNNNITASNSDVTSAVARIARSNGISVADFYARLAQGGVSKARYLHQIKQQIIISKLQGQIIAGKINVTDAEAKAYIAQHANSNAGMMYKVNDILFATPDGASKNTIASLKQKAMNLSSKLQSGNKQDAAKLIAASGAQVNLLDLRPLNAYPNLFMPVISKLQVGNYSNVITAGNGFHILQLLQKRKVAANESATAINQAKQILFQQKAQKIINNWLKGLRASAYIEINN